MKAVIVFLIILTISNLLQCSTLFACMSCCTDDTVRIIDDKAKKRLQRIKLQSLEEGNRQKFEQAECIYRKNLPQSIDEYIIALINNAKLHEGYDHDFEIKDPAELVMYLELEMQDHHLERASIEDEERSCLLKLCQDHVTSAYACARALRLTNVNGLRLMNNYAHSLTLAEQQRLDDLEFEKKLSAKMMEC